MKLKQLIILLAVLAALLVWMIVSKKSDDDGTAADIGKPLFEGLKTENVRQISLNGGKEEVDLEVKDGKWIVKGREGFPANFDNIHSLISKASQAKISDVKTDVTDKYLGKFKLMKPGSGGKDDETGVSVVFKKEDGGELAKFVLGKSTSSSSNVMMGGNSGGGQYVKVEGAGENVHVIKEGFDYTINNITNKDWLNKTDFFRIEKPKSVTVTSAKPEDNWKIFREKEGTDLAELKLADVKEGEDFDTSKGSNSANAFSGASFNDVATEAQKAAAGLDQPARTAVIETFDGLTYTIKVGKQLEVKDPNAGAAEEYYVSVDVGGALQETAPEWKPTPEEEKKTEDEKKKLKEDAAKKFADELAKKKEKLGKEKALVSRVYMVPKFVVDPLLKNRSEFMKEKAAPVTTPGTPAGTPTTPGTPTAPTVTPMPKREPITATTPPVSIEIPPKKPEVTNPLNKKEDPKKPEIKPVTTPPIEVKPATPATGAAKPAGTKPAETKPAGSKPAGSKPAKPDPKKP